MMEYQHSVSLDVEKCKGCTSCVHHCPTEAIRIRDKHAVIDAARCIDCGECIRICPHQAKKALRDDLLDLQRFKWKIALPAPSLYAQFNNLEDVDFVLQGLLDIGFDDVFEVSRGAELVTARTRQYLKLRKGPRPVISSACPAIVRLIALRFPSLKENILDMLPPMEVAAAMAREQALKDHPEFKSEDVGVCFISPCPAKMSYVKNGLPEYKSQVDVVVGFKDVYFLLLNEMKYSRRPKTLSESGMIGIGWAASGGEATALFNDAYLAADGIDNVIRVLDRIEGGDFHNNLYLYAYDNGEPINFDDIPTCSVEGVEGEVTQVSKGVYCAHFDANSLQLEDGSIYYDKWSNLALNGEDEGEVELEFSTRPKAYKLKFTSNSNVKDTMVPSIYGIDDLERLHRGEVREVTVDFRKEYEAEKKYLIDSAEYRLYVKDGNREVTVIDYHPIEKAFLNNFFVVYTEDLIPNTYYVDIKVKRGREVRYYKEALRFKVVSDVTERYQ